MLDIKDRVYSFKGVVTGNIYLCEIVKLMEKRGVKFAVVRLFCNRELEVIPLSELKEEC